MSGSFFLEERRRLILAELKKQGRVSVAQLSQQLQVSAVTIRHDLNALEADGLLARTHGGAVPIEKIIQPELSYDIRRTQQTDEKDVLGQVVAQMVETGSAIALDASTTSAAIVPHLRHLDSLTIVTNSLHIPELLIHDPSVQVLLPGGRLRRDSYSVVGSPETLPDINLNIGIVSAWGISAEAGLTEVSEEEVAIKRALLKRCAKKIVVVDSSKWDRVAPYTYAQPQEVDLILTTEQISDAQIASLNIAHIQRVTMPQTSIE